ncbi:HipA domain-containing protein [Comamonas thiooxydans]|uniref:HipA domain-containing protein n=1 Tax=Comamonas thiooxydans TaxID=363952 RepID=UPI000B418E3A|nr:HipA domain-containing protein [Comamonas thiooxydans]
MDVIAVDTQTELGEPCTSGLPIGSLLQVTANGQCVGSLTYIKNTQFIQFTYDPAWLSAAGAFPLSTHIPLQAAPVTGPVIRDFIRNLMPEGSASDVEALCLGRAEQLDEGFLADALHNSPGGLSFGDRGSGSPDRRLGPDEIFAHIRGSAMEGLDLLGSQVRRNLAGVQNKVSVSYAPWAENGQESSVMLATKPESANAVMKPEPAAYVGLAANEHFCLQLGRAMGFTTPDCDLLRVPEPVLMVRRFDRKATEQGMQRRHVIDGCQALNLPPERKYEQDLDPCKPAYRDGASLPQLFQVCTQAGSASNLLKLDLMRWVIFQLIIGNTDSHAKSYAFFLTAEGLAPAPWYDLVSIPCYPELDQSFAMAIGDAFSWTELTPVELARFAHDCGVSLKSIQREAKLLSALVPAFGRALVNTGPYIDFEKSMLHNLVSAATLRAKTLAVMAEQGLAISAEQL